MRINIWNHPKTGELRIYLESPDFFKAYAIKDKKMKDSEESTFRIQFSALDKKAARDYFKSYSIPVLEKWLDKKYKKISFEDLLMNSDNRNPKI